MSYEIFERIYSGHWFLSSYNGPGFVYDFPKIGGGRYISRAVYVMENGTCRYIFDPGEFDRAAHFTASRLINDGQWRRGIYKKIDFYTKRYYAAGEHLRRANLQSLTDRQLVNLVRQIIPLQHYHQVYSVLANGVVLDGRNHLSNKLRDELSERLGQPRDFDVIWSLLTQVTKMSLRQQKEYLIAILAKKYRRLTPVVERKLQALHKRFCWLDYNNFGPAATYAQYQGEFKAAVKSNVNATIPAGLKRLRDRQVKLTDKLRFDSRSKFLVRLAQHVIWQKGFRKDMQYHGFYCYEFLFREIARRKGFDDWKPLAFLFPWEVEGFILKSKPSLTELRIRQKFSVFQVTRRARTLMTGKNARDFVQKLKLQEDFSKLTEVKGQCAFAGKAKGIVRIVQVPADMEKMKRGDILVSQATSPDLLPAMKKAAAIVTNTGGLICHAAITSRELKIPCVVGTSNATLIFKDGDRVVVNATGGLIKKV